MAQSIAQEQVVAVMLEKLEVVSQLFHGFAYKNYFQADTAQKLSLILAAEDFILGVENGKKRLLDEVTALSKAFVIAIPHEQAMDVKDEVAFFQAVKSRLLKFSNTGSGKSDDEIETAIKQVLKKLLNNEIKARAKKNLIQSKSLMEMLENAINKYQNKIITAAEVIDELIKLSKEIQQMEKEPSEMGLSEFEYAFYTAVASNNSAKELMSKDKLRELAVAITNQIKQNTSIDWTIKENAKAKLKVIVKKILRKFGYPPDMQKLAMETVLKQAELIRFMK